MEGQRHRPRWKPRRRRPRSAGLFPPVVPDPASLLAERRTLRAALVRFGVAATDLEDAVQQCVVGAWEAGQAGRYCPSPGRDAGAELRSWLVMIAMNQASHFRDRAYRRRELPVWREDLPEIEQAPRIEARVQAMEVLRALAALRPERRDVLSLAGLGWQTAEIATHLSIPAGTVSTRLRLARQDLERTLRRRPGRRRKNFVDARVPNARSMRAMSAAAVALKGEAAILGRVIRPERDDLTPEAARSILNLDFDEDDRTRMRVLATKAQDNTLTEAEQADLESYRSVGRLLDLMRSKARRSLKRAGSRT